MTGPLVNPYAGVSWGSVTPRPGVTHMHGSGAPSSLTLAIGEGVRVMAWSNYFPEQPTDPALYGTAPSDVVFLDNSEQHSCTDSNLHYCPVGSTQTHDGGTKLPWATAFTEALALLELSDGGGITINHPVWSGQADAQIIQYLDFDPRVLGIEIYNHMTNTLPIYLPWQQQPAYPMWDRVLATGRRCWGFMAHDHYDSSIDPYLGFNMVLMDALTGASALRAYRAGKFYTTMNPPGATQLTLTGLTVTDHAVTLSTDAATTLTMVTDQGRVDAAGPTNTFTVPASAVYARFEAVGRGDTLRTQPLMYQITPPVLPASQRLVNQRFMLGID